MASKTNKKAEQKQKMVRVVAIVACCALLDDGRLAAGVPSRRHEGRGLRDDRQEGPHVHSLSFVL